MTKYRAVIVSILIVPSTLSAPFGAHAGATGFPETAVPNIRQAQEKRELVCANGSTASAATVANAGADAIRSYGTNEPLIVVLPKVQYFR
jgi:hypothetical protein